MIKVILYGFIMAVIGYFIGYNFLNKKIKTISQKLRIPLHLPDQYDEFKDDIENQVGSEFGNIMDVCFRYGYLDGHEDGLIEARKTEEDKIDEMLEVLSGETKC